MLKSLLAIMWICHMIRPHDISHDLYHIIRPHDTSHDLYHISRPHDTSHDHITWLITCLIIWLYHVIYNMNNYMMHLSCAYQMKPYQLESDINFLAIFSLITTFGNVHRPSKQYINIINDHFQHVNFFSYFFLTFWL